MQLNDILEENSIRAISTKTKISEENLEYLVASEFDALTKVKTLGFISILEREYKADLSAVKAQAEEYYGQSVESHLFPIGQLIMDEHRTKPKILILFIFLLLGASSWYFFTQFDKKNLSGLIPFIDEATIENFIGNEKETKNESTSMDSDSVSLVSEKSDSLKIEGQSVSKNVEPAISDNMKSDEDNASDIADEDNGTAKAKPSSEDSIVENSKV